MSDTKTIKKKICLLGSFGVGKTSLVRRFIFDIFDDKYLTTIGTKVSQKSLTGFKSEKGSTSRLDLLIWDIEGYRRSSALVKNYYYGASGALLVADLTRPDTILLLDSILSDFKKVCPEAVIILAGNKIDLIDNSCKNKGVFTDFAEQKKLGYHFTSALNGEEVEECFYSLSKQLMIKHD